MTIQYAAITAIVIFTMVTMVTCVNSSNTLTRKKKKYFRLLFVSISVATFCESFGIYLQGTGYSTVVLHIVIKAAELSIAPAIAFLIAAVIEQRIHRLIWAYLAANCVMEILSGFLGFIYHVDANSVYTHERFYWLYIAAYSISILYAIVVFVRNMKKYQYNGMVFLGMITLFMLLGISVQMYDGELRTVYVTTAIAAVMLYVFTLEMILQSDELTGLINRRGYTNSIAHLDEKCVILMFDADRFKMINDQYGHKCGDLCLREVGKALKEAYANYGKCFRIGGDEFCAIITKDTEKIERLNRDFFNRIAQCRAKYAWMPWVSLGYKYYDPQIDDVQAILSEVDKQMYRFKEAHRNCSDTEQEDSEKACV